MADKVKTKYLELFATMEWAKVFESNRDRSPWNVETDGEYKVTLILKDEDAAKLKEAGCATKMENTAEGVRVTVKRPCVHPRHEWAGGTPKVADVKGQPWDLETHGLIGNGSTGLVTVSVFDAGQGRFGTRLESVQVVDHVVYESEGGSPRFKDLSSLASGDAGSPSKASAPSPKEETPVLAGDEIPF
jgi:hypothetical protein